MNQIKHVWIDYDVCLEHGLCYREAPDVFTYDESSGRYIVREVDFTAHSLNVLAAARACPVNAIQVQ